MKYMYKINVIAKISWYLERSVVTLKLRKEYLNTVTVTHNTPVLLRIKYWTVWYIDRYSMSTYTGVTNFQKNSPVFGPLCRNGKQRFLQATASDRAYILNYVHAFAKITKKTK